jgi:hypothetical protein
MNIGTEELVHNLACNACSPILRSAQHRFSFLAKMTVYEYSRLAAAAIFMRLSMVADNER